MVTIADVAAHAQVGAGTVSRVVNNSPKVSEATRARVLAAIDALGYRPSPLARGLSLGRCQTLGVVVPFFTQPSAVERLRGVAAAVDASHYDLVLFNVESPAHREIHFATLTRRDRADGLLVITIAPPADGLERLMAAGVPVVVIDAEGPGVPTVTTDDVEGGRLATRHLVALGHRSIAFIGDAPHNPFGFVSSTRREQGYRETLTEAGLPVSGELVRYGGHEVAVAQRITAELLAGPGPRPTAIFAASDVQALGVVAAAREAGIRVPHDLSVVGFDDIPISVHTQLTTVRQPLFASGQLGARLLLDALVEGRTPDADVHELPLELVVRSTTGPPPRQRSRSRPTARG
jgi:DNA-binding LacI/PurR family transcriptional regulator